MASNEYLSAILKSQTLEQEGEELSALRDARENIDSLLKSEFEECSPTIRYGGSIAKGTMIREDYDLDIICYFAFDDTAAGDSLKDVYENVSKALQKQYSVNERTSAIRVKDKRGADFHIDVVPGRFTDVLKSDAYLHQKSVDKKRLKTNIQVHIDHVANSGVVDAIRLTKLWKVRNAVAIRTFALELIVIDLLKENKSASLETQMRHVLTELRDNINNICIEDPANPTGNDLSELLNENVRSNLRAVAQSTLTMIAKHGWESLFGTIPRQAVGRIAALTAAASHVSQPTRPWSIDS